MKIYQANLRKFVGSLSDHQVFCLYAELENGGLEKLKSLLSERLEGMDEDRLAQSLALHQQLFSDMVRET